MQLTTDAELLRENIIDFWANLQIDLSGKFSPAVTVV
jgi:hypothetical protein